MPAQQGAGRHANSILEDDHTFCTGMAGTQHPGNTNKQRLIAGDDLIHVGSITQSLPGSGMEGCGE